MPVGSTVLLLPTVQHRTVMTLAHRLVQRSTECSGSNRCVDDDPPVIDKNWGRVHAETDAIINCDFTYGGTLCAPWACCTGCAVDILAADISTVVVHLERMLMTPKEWEPEVLSGLRMLVRNGVQLFAVSYDFGVTIRAHGKEVHL
jgi:deoxycytidylate deaminase